MFIIIVVLQQWWRGSGHYHKLCHGTAWKRFPGCSSVNNNGVGGATRSPSDLWFFIEVPTTMCSYIYTAFNDASKQDSTICISNRLIYIPSTKLIQYRKTRGIN